MIQHRSIGSPSTINVCYSFPAGAPPTAFLEQRIAQIQAKFACLKYTIIDSRTHLPKLRRRATPWTTDQVLFEETYSPIADGQAQHAELFGLADPSSRAALFAVAEVAGKPAGPVP